MTSQVIAVRGRQPVRHRFHAGVMAGVLCVALAGCIVDKPTTEPSSAASPSPQASAISSLAPAMSEPPSSALEPSPTPAPTPSVPAPAVARLDHWKCATDVANGRLSRYAPVRVERGGD